MTNKSISRRREGGEGTEGEVSDGWDCMMMMRGGRGRKGLLCLLSSMPIWMGQINNSLVHQWQFPEEPRDKARQANREDEGRVERVKEVDIGGGKKDVGK